MQRSLILGALLLAGSTSLAFAQSSGTQSASSGNASASVSWSASGGNVSVSPFATAGNGSASAGGSLSVSGGSAGYASISAQAHVAVGTGSSGGGNGTPVNLGALATTPVTLIGTPVTLPLSGPAIGSPSFCALLRQLNPTSSLIASVCGG